MHITIATPIIMAFKKEKLNNDLRFSLSIIMRYFWRINWPKSIWLSFKALPFKQAIKIPIIVSWNTKINSVGKIIFQGKIHPAMLMIGVIRLPAFETYRETTVFTNKGTLVIKGNVKLHPGVKLLIYKGATMSVGNHVGFGANTKIACNNSITIGDDVRISWNSQILDTDFHYLYNIEKDKFYPKSKPIVIHDNVFIGNGCTICKGTVITSGSVISCISKVKGDFSKEGENLLIVGNPAVILKKGFNMSSGWFPKKEIEINKMMRENECK